MDATRLKKRYDRLWGKDERLMEAFLNDQLKAIRAKTDPPAAVPVREIYVAAQCLKRIHEGRLAAMTGGADELQSIGSNDPAEDAAQEISRRIRALCEQNGADADDDDQV